MMTGGPWDRVAMDILGELPETPRGNKYILVLTDYLTKWAEAYALENQSSYSIAEVIVTQFIPRYGAPRVFHSDQGGNFQSRLFLDMCKLLGISKSRTTTYHPQSDGLCELEFGVWSFVLFNDAWSQKGHSASNTTVILA